MLGASAGVWAALSCMAVGFFPMNTLKPHYFVAMSYFRSGLLMVLLFGVAVFAQSPGTAVIAKSSNVAGMISLICYAAFLTISDSGKKKKEEPEEALNPDIQRERPKYWKTPILEWAVFFSTILWFFIVAVFALF
jgi:hypothetical protein